MPHSPHVPALLSALHACGGTGTRDDCLTAVSAGVLRGAVKAGHVVRVGRGLYGLPQLVSAATHLPAATRSWSQTDEDDAEILELHRQLAVAQAHDAALSHRSAARHYGWPVLVDPECIELVVPRGRRVRPRPTVSVRRRETTAEERRLHVTSPSTTVVHCAVDLPFDEALAVADSALRSELLGAHTLRNAADTYRGRNAAQVRRVAGAADGLAANPFESALRAVVSTVPGLHVVPQVLIEDGDFAARVDLADIARRIVLEADSYEFHGSARRFVEDIDRYDELVARDWLVLRFTLDQVRNRQEWLRTTVEAAVLTRPPR